MGPHCWCRFFPNSWSWALTFCIAFYTVEQTEGQLRDRGRTELTEDGEQLRVVLEHWGCSNNPVG